MNYPKVITNAILGRMASPDEQTMVRVIVRSISNLTDYILHGRKQRHYHFSFNRTANAHVLDVPLSVWNKGIPEKGPIRDNDSLSWDIQAKLHKCGPLIIHFLPWPGAAPVRAAEESEAAPLPRLSENGRKGVEAIDTLAKTLEAPEIVHKAIGYLLDDALPDADVETFLADVQTEAEAMMTDDPDAEAKKARANEQAKERMRRLRERRAETNARVKAERQAARKNAPAKKAARKSARQTKATETTSA